LNSDLGSEDAEALAANSEHWH